VKRALILAVMVIAVILLGGWFTFLHFPLGALEEPGRTETYLATKARRILVERNSSTGIPAAPADVKASAEAGDTLFGMDCSSCHGASGRKPTDPGRWMYPRAADLGAAETQKYSDRELFWIVKNGIRMTGMPAFGKVEPDNHIWNLVHYVRTIPKQPPAR